MNLDRYPFTIYPDHFRYEFTSWGPKGRIRKRVHFEEFSMPAYQRVYNLALGDLNERMQDIDYRIISNNKDIEKVLATIAAIADYFTNRFPGSVIYAQGSTPGRTRIYQMALNRHYDEVIKLFQLSGMTKERDIRPFQKNFNYIGFLAERIPMQHV